MEGWKRERKWIAKGTIRKFKKDILRKAEYRELKKGGIQENKERRNRGK